MTDFKKLFLFLIAYFVITMAWAYPWHMVLFHDLYVQWGAFQRGEPIMPLGVAAILIQGIVIGTLYSLHDPARRKTVLDGVKFSLIIGLMVYTAMGFATAAKFKIEPVADFLIYHTVFQAVQFVLVGIALGWIFKTQE